MKKRNLLLVILAVLLVFGMVIGCGPVEDDGTGGTGGGGGTNTAVAFTDLTANGSGLDTTTTLTLTFDKAITLLASNITVTTQTGATKGTLSGSGTTYTLAISGVTSDGLVQISVAKANFTITPASKQVSVFYSASAKAAPYFKGYLATYKLDGKNVNESIKFEKERLVIWDNSNDGNKQNYLDFKITKWEDSTVPEWDTIDKDPTTVERTNYTIAFKLTGYITGAFKINSNNLYGNKTAPGFNQSDITNRTPAIIYIYLGGGGEDDLIDLTLLRSIITKDGVLNKPITGSDDGETIRFYPANSAADTYPTITP